MSEKNGKKGSGADGILLAISVLLFASLSLSFLLMPLDGKTTVNGISAYSFAAGAMFWISLVGGAVTQCVLSHKRKAWYIKNHVRRSKTKKKIGIVSFFENPPAVCADTVLILGAAGLVVALIATRAAGYVCYVMMSIFVFSACIHCILNGKIYYYIRNKDKILAETKKDRKNNSEREGEKR